jgi:hypothetical protein
MIWPERIGSSGLYFLVLRLALLPKAWSEARCGSEAYPKLARIDMLALS